MVVLTSLWLPILLSAVAIFFASWVLNAALPWHRPDWTGVPNEEPLLAALRGANLSPGQYVFPRAMTSEGMKEEGAAERLKEGPVGFVTMYAGPVNMGKALSFHFLYNVAVLFAVAYVASRTVSAGADYLAVFRIVGTVGFLAFSAAEIPHSVWFGRRWMSTWKYVIDGLIYGLLAAGFFGWLWPA